MEPVLGMMMSEGFSISHTQRYCWLLVLHRVCGWVRPAPFPFPSAMCAHNERLALVMATNVYRESSDCYEHSKVPTVRSLLRMGPYPGVKAVTVQYERSG